MFLTRQKLDRRKEELIDYRYRDVCTIPSFLVKEDESDLVNSPVPTGSEGWETMRIGDCWSGRNRYLWMKISMDIPAEWKEKRVVAVFDFGLTGGGNNTGFESLLYIDGEIYQAVDSNHKEVFLEERHCGKHLDFTFRLWSGREGGGLPRELTHEIKAVQMGWLDGPTDDLIYLSDMVIKTLEILSEQEPIYHDLQSALNESMNRIDWSCPGSEEFYASVKEADDTLTDALGKMEKYSDVCVFMIGHTHIDTAWLWTLKNTREKCSRSFSTVLRLMEQYPEYIFLQTQPQLYAFVKEDFPVLYEKIKERVKEGRWEVDGAMWVEADCNLTSGESLTRQILLGAKFIQDEFGKDIHYLWLPDVFGYSWALPQILTKSGIDTFMTTKISWNQYNRMPHDTFRWRGMDGSEVLTHFITTPLPIDLGYLWLYTYNGIVEPKTVKGVWDNYQDKALSKDLLVSYGYGDGGGGVNRDMLENQRRLERIPGLPHVKTSTAREYFERLKENVKTSKEPIHTWDGELYLEYHRGTYTSHARNKYLNRKMELLYREAEWFTVMHALRVGGDLTYAQQEKLTAGWKHILTNQFHDIIPGSSIREVYEDCEKDYAWIEKVAREVEDDFLKQEKDSCGYTVVNTTSFAADGVVLIPNVAENQILVTDGTVPKQQNVEGGRLVYLSHVPPMGFVSVDVADAYSEEMSETPFTCVDSEQGWEIITPYYDVALNTCGQISRLYDRENDREVLQEGQCANVLQVFEDKPLDNDAWDIDVFYQEKMRVIEDVKAIYVRESGPLRLVIHITYQYQKSVIEQDMIFYAKSRRIDFDTWVDCHECHQLLKAAFPVDIRTTYGTFDVQYGNVRRPNHWNTSWDLAKFESVAHRFADLSEYGYGVSLLNDCKYGHDVKDNVLRITLIKTATSPDYEQDQGEHRFTYSLYPHVGDFVEGKTCREASFLNQPLYAIEGTLPEVRKLRGGSFLSFDKECVELDAVKKSEDGNNIVIRFHEFTGGTHKVTMRTGFDWKRYCASDLRERPISEWKESDEITMTVKPYEIVTLIFSVRNEKI